MPKVSKELPEALRPYDFHGIDLKITGKEALADCPWCGRENKFSVHIETGKWRCFVCNTGDEDSEDSEEIRGGNVLSFLRKLHELSLKSTTEEEYASLVKSRSYLSSEVLKKYQVAMSMTTNQWILPGFNSKRNMSGLYQYIKNVWYPTPTLGSHLFGVNTLLKTGKKIYICEGIWDAMMLHETLKSAKMLKGVSVLSLPGVMAYQTEWNELFKGKEVIVVTDSDHPKEDKEGKLLLPTGYKGCKRTCRLLGDVPSSIKYLCWGIEGYDPELPSGYDVSDFILNK